MLTKYFQIICAIFIFLGLNLGLDAQFTVKGKVVDDATGESIIGANVIVKGTTRGVVTELDGSFEMELMVLPVVLQVSFVSYITQEILVSTVNEPLVIKLAEDQVVLSEVEVVGARISEKQKQAALTVETMDVIAIKEAPSGNFYEGLGSLKEVDVTSASLSFKIINTRGFNSTSPVRSLQLIDGVDNQSPGLNFSLGNFLGASDLDVMKVEIVAGASSAFYGPGAFNGVINMTTKDPFRFPGLSFYGKVGERSLFEYAFRYAHVFNNKEGEEKLAFKINWFSMNAREWEATNYDPIFGSLHDETNPYGFDAVNVYGDEPIAINNNWTDAPFDYTGLGVFYRNGYREADLVNYDTDNRKFNAGVYYKLNDKITAQYNFSFSTGSTIYQGDNRYALRDVDFFQHKFEIGEKDNWFIRAYSTNEDAGNTIDIVTTAVRMQDASGATDAWNFRFAQNWSNFFVDSVQSLSRYDEILQEVLNSGLEPDEQLELFNDLLNEWYVDDYDLFNSLYLSNLDSTNGQNTTFIDPFYRPGTDRFDSLYNSVTGRKFTEGGSLFYDKSSLYHIQAEKRWDINSVEIVTGANIRWYRPDSQGTIFRDTLSYVYLTDSIGTPVLDKNGRMIAADSSRVMIKNQEWGVYAGATVPMLDERLKASVSVRADKNQNFDYLISPAASLVYTANEKSTLRLSFSSAIRNPTLADQYLYYNVGRAILLGNIDGQFEEGQDSLFTIESFNEYRSAQSLLVGLDKLEYFNVEKIRPEKVRTIEAGYRGTLFDNTYIDLTGYYSIYTDFIGYNIGMSANFDQTNGFPDGGIQVFRVAANAKEIVTTTGLSIGYTYYFKRFALTGNYSWNRLVSGEDDPIIPAFNTPENKFNIGLNGRDMTIFKVIKHFGFGVNYKFVEGFLFEGSPQFTGFVPSYDFFDAQVNVDIPKWKCNIKVGGSNLFGIMPLLDKDIGDFGDRLNRATDNRNLQVYGGPRVGRLAYITILFDLNE